MGRPRAPLPVKLIVEFFSGDEDLLRRAAQLVRKHCGEWDIQSPVWDEEAPRGGGQSPGTRLKCCLASFLEPAAPDRLIDLTRDLDAIERRIAADCEPLDMPQPVRIRSGYVDTGKVVRTASGNEPHHIYLTRGIYAEVALLHTQDRWHPFPGSSSACQRPEWQLFVTRVRERLLEQKPLLSGEPDRPSAP